MRTKHEQWLSDIKQIMYPYIVACGTFDNLTQISVILNNEKYTFSSLLKAVEAYCKCLFALQSRPIAVENIFYFLNKIIFGLQDIDNRNLTAVNSMITDFDLKL